MPQPPTPMETVVLNLFGQAASTPQYAIHDEDRLEWVHALLSDTASLPDWLDYPLKHQPILFIGCEIPDWLGRFLLRMSSNTRLSLERNRFYFAGCSSDREPSLSHFFTTYCREVDGPTTRDGSDRVRRRTANALGETHTPSPRTGIPVAAPSRPEGSATPPIFISYMREDADAARRVCDAITQLGGDVWLDERRLRPGDSWEQEILTSIRRNVRLFVPIISANTELAEEGYVFKEWNEAAERMRSIPRRRFVVPVVIDEHYGGNPIRYRQMPEPFRRLQFGRAPAGDPDAGLLTVLTAEIRAIATERRGMTATIVATHLDSENPWPGLDSFEETARAFFFGRDRETDSLLKSVLDAPVTVLYGRSGLGKTSLLRAGLFPMLRERHFLPIYVRFEIAPSAAPLTDQLRESVINTIRTEVPDALLPSDDETLWEYLHRNDFELWSARNYPLTVVIVLDQFEELFTLGERVPERIEEFRNDLGDLAENRIPAELASRIDGDEGVARRFNLRSCNYKLLISLREDFLPELEGWRQLIPALGRTRMRLLPMQLGEAFDAVYRPARTMMTEELAHLVVEIVGGEDLHRGGPQAETDDRVIASDVEPALLSLFCRELNEERKRRGQAMFRRAARRGCQTGHPVKLLRVVRG